MLEKKEMKGLLASSMMVLLAACGGGGDSANSAPAASEPAAAAPAANPVDEATAGNVHGTVKFTGTAPAPAKIDMKDEPSCATANPNAVKQDVMVGADGGLANVFVYVKEGLDPSLKFPAGPGVEIDQQGCQYTPHVLAISVGEKLTVKNGDPVLHNINATPTTNRGFNRSQPQQNMTFETEFTSSEVMIPVRCDVHGWMSAFIGVTDNPYHVVSGADGTFSLDRLPPGTYTLEAWHEKFGTATQQVTIETGKTAEVSFTFDSKVAAEVPMGRVLMVNMHQGTMTRVDAPVQQ